MLSQILTRITRTEQRVSDLEGLVCYATVTQASPLRVRLDGDDTALPATPPHNPTVAGCVVGARVVCLRQNRRIVVLAPIGTTGYDTGWLTNQLTAASGWSIIKQQVRRVGLTVSVFVELSRTGANITVPSIGNIANVTVATLPANLQPTRGDQVLSSSGVGRVATGAIYGANIDIAAVAGTDNIVTGNVISLGGTYLLG